MNKENAIEWYTGEDTVTVSLTNRRYITKIKNLEKRYPDEVEIHINEDGSIISHLPLSYIKISHPRVMSEEVKEAARDRLKEARKERGNN